MAKIHTLALAVFIPFSFAAAQQLIILNDGTQFQGTFSGGNSRSIMFVDQSGMQHRFNVTDIQSLTFNPGGGAPPVANSGYAPLAGPAPAYVDNGPQGQPPPPQSAGVFRNNPNNNPDVQPQGPPRSAAPANYATLVANTEIAVRTNEPVNANNAQQNRMYAATINRDVLDANGNVVIPQGSPAQMVVRDTGNGQISLDLASVSVNGQRYLLNTDDVVARGRSNRGIGANERTGAYVGGGAVLGTLLGAIGGGGRGAAIGALAGAAAGGTLQVLTRGNQVRVPSEAVLNFRLDQPVYLYQ